MLRKTEENYLKDILEKRYYDKSCTAKEAAKIISILKQNNINTKELEVHYESVFNCSFELIDDEDHSLSENDIQLIPEVKITVTGKDKKLLEPAYKKLVERFCLHDELVKIIRFIKFNTYYSTDADNGSEKWMIIDVKRINQMIVTVLNKL